MKTGGSQRTHALDTRGPFTMSVTNTWGMEMDNSGQTPKENISEQWAGTWSVLFHGS